MTATLKNKNYKRSQKGRSMVEMLGVLAIIGVLSVGGVYGYGVAMKKHKANELLHQASMLATTISAQAMSNDGNLPQTITDFGNSGYDTDLTDNGTKFILTMKDVDSAVCDQLKTGGMIQKVECKAGTSDGKKNAEITYYKNLATTEAEGEKSPTGVKLGESTSDGWTGDDGSDCSADTKLGTECQVCIKGYYQDSDAKCDSGQICVDGMCKTPADSEYTGCTRNSDCTGTIDGIDCDEKTCYCNYYVFDNQDMRSGSCTGGPDKGSGVCMEATYEITTVADDGIAGKLSTWVMDWYSAKNFCSAVGGSMISLKGSLCTGSGTSWSCDWTKYKGNLSSTYWWTKDLRNSCSALRVDTDYPDVNYGDRDLNYYHALCE